MLPRLLGRVRLCSQAQGCRPRRRCHGGRLARRARAPPEVRL